jgi:hypothetical protein
MCPIIDAIRLLLGNLFHVLLVPLAIVVVSLCLRGARLVYEQRYEQVMIRTCEGEVEVRVVPRRERKPAVAAFSAGMRPWLAHR